MQKREYQENHISRIIDAIEKHRTVIAQLPTGGGKTVEFSLIIKKFLYNFTSIDRGPVLVLVHREELLHQSARAIKESINTEPCLITSDTDRFYISRVYVGMVQSTMSRLHMIKEPSLIIIDECHLQNFNKVHRTFPNTKIIGFSATPIYSSKKDHLKNYYEKIITGPSIKELINLEFLSQNITRAPKTSVDSSQFSYDRLKGDFNERQMSSVYSMQNNVTNVIDQYFKFCLNKKTIVFNVTIEHSKEVDKCFNICGYNSRHLDSSCKDREEIFKWFKETPNAILNSVMIPTMGFDEPTVESVILNYSTMSLVKFIQTCGRGSRIVDEFFIEKNHSLYPYELKIKNTFDIIDLGQNWKRFGDWNDERDWDYIFNNPETSGDGIAPVKSCPECEALVYASSRTCAYCGHEFEKKVYKQQDIEELIVITKGIDIEKLVGKSQKKYKYYGFFELAVDIVDNLVNIHGNNPSQLYTELSFIQYYKMCIDWYSKTVAKDENEIQDISDSGWHIIKAIHNFNSLLLRKNKDAYTISQDNMYDLAKGILSRDSQKQKDESYKNSIKLQIA